MSKNASFCGQDNNRNSNKSNFARKKKMCGQNQKIIFYASIYYHFRDKKYWDMVSYMKEDYPELCFFDNVKGERYDIVDDVTNLEILNGK